MKVCGQIIYGTYGQILVRTKKDSDIEIGTLLVVEGNPKYILQVYDLEYGSQLEKGHLELTSGLELENKGNLYFIEEDIQNYVIAKVKAILEIFTNQDGTTQERIPKSLPRFFTMVKKVDREDVSFLNKADSGVYVGNLRSGSSQLEDIKIRIPFDRDIAEMLSHHILIAATTGRGKSNLVKVMLSGLMNNPSCGILIIDPHDEYYGRQSSGLKDISNAHEALQYYTQSTRGLTGKNVYTLAVNVRDIKPWDFSGVVFLSDAQMQAMYVLYGKKREAWLEELFNREPEELCDACGNVSKADSFAALKRKLSFAMERYYEDEAKTIFKINKNIGVNTISDIVHALTEGKKVIIDSSTLSSEAELLLASAIAREIFEEYKGRKKDGTLDKKETPVISIVLEEAPRVLKNDESIFSTIAREGRKFKIGLIGITQLASLIPREILANINTKIILGNEMLVERKTLIECASQDISTEDKMIAGLEKGEALITSIFTKFAIPITIPKFESLPELINNKEQKKKFLFNFKS